MTVSSVNSLSLEPPLKLFSIRKAARSLPAWQAAQGLAINVLAHDQGWISDRFARPADDRWKNVAFTRGIADAPVIDGAVAAFECAPHATISTGDHILFIVDVLKASARPEAAPLVFHRSRYCSVRDEPSD